MGKKEEHGKRDFGRDILLILGCLLPLILLFVLVGLGFSISPWFFILIIFLCPLVLYYLIGGVKEEEIAEEAAEEKTAVKPQDTLAGEMQGLFTWDLFFVNRTSRVGDAVIFEGSLRAKPDAALDIMRGRFKEKFGDKYEVLLQEDDSERPVIVVVPFEKTGDIKSEAASPVLNILLFIGTFVTTTIAGASHYGVNLFSEPSKFAVGLPYAVGIMAILGVHELGHYSFAKRHGIVTTLPYFIPIPFGLGTFGAVIRMKSLVKDRKALFDTGIAGPLSGLLVSIPLLYIGLQYSSVIKDGGQGVSLSSSMLLAFIAKLSLGEAISASHTVLLHPLAFAGWLGLMITALNLLPIGQLDGGHIGYALFGRKRAEIIANVAFFAIIILGIFVWSGWLFWAIVVFFLAGTQGMPPINDVTEIDRKRVVLGAIAFILLFLIISPLPHALSKTMGIHCPYI